MCAFLDSKSWEKEANLTELLKQLVSLVADSRIKIRKQSHFEIETVLDKFRETNPQTHKTISSLIVDQCNAFFQTNDSAVLHVMILYGLIALKLHIKVEKQTNNKEKNTKNRK